MQQQEEKKYCRICGIALNKANAYRLSKDDSIIRICIPCNKAESTVRQNLYRFRDSPEAYRGRLNQSSRLLLVQSLIAGGNSDVVYLTLLMRGKAEQADG